MMQKLLDLLSHGPESEIPPLIYGFNESSEGAQSVLKNMLGALRAPAPEQRLEYVDSHRSGRCTMVVAHAPWHQGPHAYEYQPILFIGEGDQARIAGYILPFNDLFPLLPHQDMEAIQELTQWYIKKFVGGSPFGKNS